MTLQEQSFKFTFDWFFRALYCHIPLYFVFVGIICSSIELSHCGSRIIQFSLTCVITGYFIQPIVFVFQVLFFCKLSAAWINCLNFLYLLLLITSDIRGISCLPRLGHKINRQGNYWHVNLKANKLFDFIFIYVNAFTSFLHAV